MVMAGLALGLGWASERPVKAAPAQAQAVASQDPSQPAACTAKQRNQMLRSLQTRVLAHLPQRVDALDRAVAPGGPLAGWMLSHGLVVLAGSGGVAVHKLDVTYPLPQVLIYAPSSESSPTDWLDFDGPDGPYQLVGWGYVAPYKVGSEPPSLPCIARDEWLLHEAGWHLMDGGMLLTPGAIKEPPRPRDLAVYFWHPQVWDLHVWRQSSGVPSVSFANPNARLGGLRLPDGAFLQLVNGRWRPVQSSLGTTSAR